MNNQYKKTLYVSGNVNGQDEFTSNDILEILIAIIPNLPFTFSSECQGVWNGQIEKSYKVEFIGIHTNLASELPTNSQIDSLRIALKQEAILETIEAISFNLID